jgi:hypothetical protein
MTFGSALRVVDAMSVLTEVLAAKATPENIKNITKRTAKNFFFFIEPPLTHFLIL